MYFMYLADIWVPYVSEWDVKALFIYLLFIYLFD